MRENRKIMLKKTVRKKRTKKVVLIDKVEEGDMETEEEEEETRIIITNQKVEIRIKKSTLLKIDYILYYRYKDFISLLF